MEDKPHRSPSLSYGRLTVIFLLALLLLAFTALGSNCSQKSSRQHPVRNGEIHTGKPFQELYTQGIDRYMGSYSPMLSEESDGVVVHTFGTGDGPLCLDGSPYRVATVDNGSPDLMIVLQSGGMCWSELCNCRRSSSLGLAHGGILDMESEINPYNGFNIVHLNYCDGGLFVSDRDTDIDGDGRIDRFQRGLHNLSAGLDLAVGFFPAPRRIVLVGSSAGGMATIFALPLVRKQYPELPIFVINDSGVGLGRPGDPGLLQAWVEDWNLSAFFPASCPECLASDGHLTQYNIWLLEQDPLVRLGMLSYTLDIVLSDGFLKIERESYHIALLEEMRKLEAAHPARSHHWIKQGLGHGFLHRDLEVDAGNVRLVDWLSAMLRGDEAWKSVIENPIPET